VSGLCEEVPEDPPPKEPEGEVGDDGVDAFRSGMSSSIREAEKINMNVKSIFYSLPFNLFGLI
jgi:hypothetical protein